MVGSWVDKYPESVKALCDAGHEVMNHSNTHAHMSQLSRDEIIADVNTCNDKIEAVTGVRPTLIRPPYGEYDDNVISAIRSIGMEPIQWDVDLCETTSGPSSSSRSISVICKNSRPVGFSPSGRLSVCGERRVILYFDSSLSRFLPKMRIPPKALPLATMAVINSGRLVSSPV